MIVLKDQKDARLERIEEQDEYKELKELSIALKSINELVSDHKLNRSRCVEGLDTAIRLISDAKKHNERVARLGKKISSDLYQYSKAGVHLQGEHLLAAERRIFLLTENIETQLDMIIPQLSYVKGQIGKVPMAINISDYVYTNHEIGGRLLQARLELSHIVDAIRDLFLLEKRLEFAFKK